MKLMMNIKMNLHVALFRDHTNYHRQATIPLNFKNTDEPLDRNNGLILKERYEALPFN